MLHAVFRVAYLYTRSGALKRSRDTAVHAKYVLINHPGERQPVEDGVARLPHLLAKSLTETILAGEDKRAEEGVQRCSEKLHKTTAFSEQTVESTLVVTRSGRQAKQGNTAARDTQYIFEKTCK